MTNDDLRIDNTPARFFRWIDWSAFWTACLVTFGVYFWTLPPSVTLEDSGELATGGNFLGVPHPPGYPIWSTVSYIFARLFSFVTFRGQPNPAWAIALGSAAAGALAAGITALLICRSGQELLHGSDQRSDERHSVSEGATCWVSGVVGSLMFAFSPNMWSQSVIVEVYSLNALFLVLIFLLLYVWLHRPSDRLLFVTSFVFGLGLTNYQVLLLVGATLFVAIAMRDLDLFRDFVITGVPFVAALALMQLGAIPRIAHPLHWTGITYLFLNFVVLALSYFLLPRGRTVAVSFLLMELGVAYYAYMPIVSDLRNPPINWGYPRTWEGFQHAISRGQYEKISPADAFSLQFIKQLGAYMKDLREQFTLLAAPLGFLPFVMWDLKIGAQRLKALYIGVVLTVAGVAMAVADRFVAGSAASAALDSVFRFLFAGTFVLLTVGGVTLVLTQGKEFYLRMMGRVRASLSDRVMAGLVLAAAVLVALFYVYKMGANMIELTAPLRQAGTLSSEQIGDIVLKGMGIVALIVVPFVVFGAVLALMHSRFELRPTLDDRSQKWVLAILVGFLVMSLILVSLADLKPDVQDMFIQRVKFISSHALFAFWIGYGLVFGLAFAERLFRGNRLMSWACLAAAMALPLIPLHQNWNNKELIRLYGGSEQNGHDFGWQFGNYQLRGAAAISEELSPDEEPLPNPEFPAEMGPDAIFFGGTDPGRFVPTYMIYCAAVREDVYLITQNALADNTYMNVMRDLYGDRIWIPATPDSAVAFQRYVEEVQSGKRPRNAQLNIENGRVQVSGALGVMEINGILAQMIFEHNIYRHPFYVEESYVIPWMYPYLSPHGLIMQINADPTANHLTERTVIDDTDFWDWYARRLMNDHRFLCDVVARKTFSKLRSAIAGLYSNRGRLKEAENAFQEARTLYPLSPEANFRLVQEVLMNQRRFEEVKRIMQEFQAGDPGNARVPDFLNHLNNIERTEARRVELEAEMRKGTLDLQRALELGDIYQQMGQIPSLMNLAANIMNNPELPPAAYFHIANTLSRAGRIPEMATALDKCLAKLPPDAPPNVHMDIARLFGNARMFDKTADVLEHHYLKRQPADWKAWLDVASIRLGLQQKDPGMRALEQAIRVGGDEALQVINQDQRFAPYRQQALDRANKLLKIPGLPQPMR